MQKKLLKKLQAPDNFINRDISWLKFNNRVLKEASVKEHPLLEKLRYICITASNLDEFFMVRVANIITKMEDGIDNCDLAGMSVHEQFVQISALAHSMIKLSYKYLFSILNDLTNYGVHFKRIGEVSVDEKKWLDTFFTNTVYPVLTPMAVDASHPFPLLANKSINLAISLTDKEGQKHIAFVQVPSVLPQLVKVTVAQEKNSHTFIFLEELIMTNCHQLFPGYTVNSITPFRITRNADLNFDDYQTDNLMQDLQKSLRRRKSGDAVRLEINNTGDEETQAFLVKSLGLDDNDVYVIKGPIDLTRFNKLVNNVDFSFLCYTPRTPQVPQDLINCADIFALASEKDILLHHPFESFEPVVKLMQDAANDPNVLAIKQTLYRVSGNSPIVDALARAAENGKQVTVLVELKARFDEEKNIIWARRLEKAGCHVIYGLVGLKTHSKVILIVRKEATGIKRYVHLGTGNYNDNTAKVYTDMGLITTNEQIGRDVSAFFNVLSGYSEPPLLDKLAMAPIGLREKFYELIDNEIDIVQKGGSGHIIAKMNSLMDKDFILKLYQASNAGVKIDLIVRGICGLVDNKPDISDNITVRSIVGRYLEHTRIFYFHNDGKEQIYLSSADWMERNLNDRVELLFPVESSLHIERIKDILHLYLKDNTKAHIMLSTGSYRHINNRQATKVNAQEILYKDAYDYVQTHALSIEERLQPIYKKDDFADEE